MNITERARLKMQEDADEIDEICSQLPTIEERYNYLYGFMRGRLDDAYKKQFQLEAELETLKAAMKLVGEKQCL